MGLRILDCDGLIRSVSYDAIFTAYLEIARYLGQDPSDFWNDFEEFEAWRDNDWYYNLERLGVPRGSDYRQIQNIFHDIYDSKVYKFPWVEDLLGEMAQHHQLAILSSARSNGIYESMGCSIRHFQCVLGHEDVSQIKPHPEGIHTIMSKLGASAKETIIIGDTDADILAGRNAGILTAGVTWGMFSYEEMEMLNPDYLLSNPAELLYL